MTQLPLDQSFFKGDALDIAKQLLGKKIKVGNCEGIIVETEAYKRDPGSHAYKITPRSQIMQDTHGYVYVYVIYGMYHCLNITTNKDDVGAVLIRAIEPTNGIDVMQKRRLSKHKNKSKQLKLIDLTSGPSKLCVAFNISKENNNKKIKKEIQIFNHGSVKTTDIVATTRIGLTNGKDLPWRFYLKGNGFVSTK